MCAARRTRWVSYPVIRNAAAFDVPQLKAQRPLDDGIAAWIKPGRTQFGQPVLCLGDNLYAVHQEGPWRVGAVPVNVAGLRPRGLPSGGGGSGTETRQYTWY